MNVENRNKSLFYVLKQVNKVVRMPKNAPLRTGFTLNFLSKPMQLAYFYMIISTIKSTVLRFAFPLNELNDGALVQPYTAVNSKRCATRIAISYCHSSMMHFTDLFTFETRRFMNNSDILLDELN